MTFLVPGLTLGPECRESRPFDFAQGRLSAVRRAQLDFPETKLDFV